MHPIVWKICTSIKILDGIITIELTDYMLLEIILTLHSIRDPQSYQPRFCHTHLDR